MNVLFPKIIFKTPTGAEKRCGSVRVRITCGRGGEPRGSAADTELRQYHLKERDSAGLTVMGEHFWILKDGGEESGGECEAAILKGRCLSKRKGSVGFDWEAPEFWTRSNILSRWGGESINRGAVVQDGADQ